MKKVKYHDSFIYIDDTPVDESETGIIFNHKKEKLENTMEIKTISSDDALSDTFTDLWGENHE